MNSSRSNLKVLVVDDEDDVRDFLTTTLLSLGYEAQSTSNAKEALNKIREDRGFNVLISDLNLKDEDGLWLLQEGKKIDPDLVVLIITGSGSIESAVDALKQGAADYLQKPFNSQTLKLKLERSWKARMLSQENRLLKRDLALYQIYELFMGNPDRDKLLNIALQSLNQITGPAGIKIQLDDGKTITNPQWKDEQELYALQAALGTRGKRSGMIYVKPMDKELDSDQRTGLALLVKNVSLALENVNLMLSLNDNIKQMEAQKSTLLDSYKFAILGEISSSLVHEMRNPLSAITLGVEYFGMNISPDDKMNKALNSISKSLERLNVILDNLSLYSKDTAGTKSTSLLSDILHKALGLVNYYLAGRKIKMEVLNGDYEKPVLVNPGQIQQALVDILVFQSKRLSRGGDIKVGVEHHQDDMRILINSPLLVISPAELELLLEFKMSSWESNRDLSLALARRLLEDNNCRLKVESDSEKGTSFELTFSKNR